MRYWGTGKPEYLRGKMKRNIEIRLFEKYDFIVNGKIKVYIEYKFIYNGSITIAESWQRLADMQEYVQPYDKLLIPHELMEMELVIKGVSQSKAHKETCLEYNYPKATNEFYERLQHEKNARIGKGNIISGGISHRQQDDWDVCL